MNLMSRMNGKKTSRAYAFGREMVCNQKSVRNRNFFENAGHVSFSFCQTGSAETRPNTMESRTIVFEGFDLTCRRVPLKVRSYHPA